MNEFIIYFYDFIYDTLNELINYISNYSLDTSTWLEKSIFLDNSLIGINATYTELLYMILPITLFIMCIYFFIWFIKKLLGIFTYR